MELEVGSFISNTQSVTDPEAGNVAWTKDLETGIDIVDEQHRRYFDLLHNYFIKAAKHLRDDEKTIQLTESFDFFYQYAKEHFSTEESIMQDSEYPDYAEHHEEHLYFRKHVGALYADMETKGFSPELSRKVRFYAVEWFIEHILSVDIQLAGYLKDKNWQE